MILRRVIKHFRNQEWTAIFLDFLIVVVGVFVGLQVQEWANEQGRRQLETNYTQRLHDEVTELQKTRAPMLEVRELWLSGLLASTQLLFNQDDREMTQAECTSIAHSFFVSNPTDDIAALIELQGSGQLSLFRNKRVSKALQSFLLTRARARDSRPGIVEIIGNLLGKHPHVLEVVKPTFQTLSKQGTLTQERAIYRCDLAAMRVDQLFLNDFQTNQQNYGFHMRDNVRVSNSLTELHHVLDEVLALTHEEPAQ